MTSSIPSCLPVCDLQSRAGMLNLQRPSLHSRFLPLWQTSLIKHWSLFPTKFKSNIRIFLNTVHEVTI